MTTKEAREFYMKSDCSYFIMCNRDYEKYMEYRRLDLTKEQELIWKNEKIQILYREVRNTGQYELYERLYNIAVEFHNFEKLYIMFNALPFLKQTLNSRGCIAVAELILGKKMKEARSGLIYWAYDCKQRGMALLFIDEVIHLLEFSEELEESLNKRARKARRLCVKIIDELNFNANFVKDKIEV